MENDRPKINVPYQQIDVAVELLNVTLLILIWLYIIMQYSELPEEIALHFNAKGEVDDYGNKTIIWLFPSIATFLFMVLFSLNKFPHFHNYMINITKENAFKNYRLSIRFIRFINLFCMILFAAIIWEIISIAHGQDPKLFNLGFLISAIIVPVTMVAFVVYYQKKINT